jgi:D-tyrosyl-tRNA(Tyr) deacylase
MRLLLQRVKEASVHIDGSEYSKIKQGYLFLVGFTHEDTKEVVEKVANKAIGLRVFEDEQGKMNLSLQDIKGSILSISQFTLYADYKKGRRPGFELAAKPEQALQLYDYFNEYISKEVVVRTGIFGADMKINLINDGPVTIMIDSEELK